jgi:hypothetical protein
VSPQPGTVENDMVEDVAVEPSLHNVFIIASYEVFDVSP